MGHRIWPRSSPSRGGKGDQDAMVVWENFGSKEDAIFCGVFDGHGPFGHMVAKKWDNRCDPGQTGEAERIRLCKGRVFSLKAEPEVARVWLPNVDSPGLAMARAFGDFFLKDFGLISVLEITHRHLTKEDEFVILATDGIWDVLSKEEVVQIIASVPRAFAAQSLVETAARLWRLKFPTSKVDDCAVVCLFLNSAPNETSISTANQKTMLDFLDACSNMHAGRLGLVRWDRTIKDFIRTDGGHP